MNISYRFSSPQGDIAVDDKMLDRPFAVGPGEYHPFMTLRDFFDTVLRFVMSEKALSLGDIVGELWQRPASVGEIEEIVIRYEKYGTLYQICSIDAAGGGNQARMCVSLALSEPAKETLDREFELLAQLESNSLAFLPRPYKKDWVKVEKDGKVETLLAVLLEWFEGYEEWHFHIHEDGQTRAFVWDMREGYRFLSAEETFDTVRHASSILTLLYDVESTRRIIPWHHGGGDFIVRTSATGVDVKLITVRGYEPMSSAGEQSPLQAICSFFIETVTKMRLDKQEGMGDSTWADSSVLKAAVKGFFEGLSLKEARGEMASLSVGDVREELKSTRPGQLRSLIGKHYLDFESDPSDYEVVRWNLGKHAEEIAAIVRAL